MRKEKVGKGIVLAKQNIGLGTRTIFLKYIASKCISFLVYLVAVFSSNLSRKLR